MKKGQPHRLSLIGSCCSLRREARRFHRMKHHAHPTVQSCHRTVGYNERGKRGHLCRHCTALIYQHLMLQSLKLFSMVFMCSAGSGVYML